MIKSCLFFDKKYKCVTLEVHYNYSTLIVLLYEKEMTFISEVLH